MTSVLDPYHKWLGIPPKDQPPNHYRLLSLDLFESDPDVIDAAANRQMAYVQQRAIGENAALSQRLLNELSTARLSLLDSKKKAAYDATLRPATDARPAAVYTVVEKDSTEDILRQAQQAYNQGRFQEAVNLLKSQSGYEQDLRLWNLLKRSASAVTQIDSLNRTMTEARSQGDAIQVKRLAGQILAFQPSHPKAKPLLRWAENRLREEGDPNRIVEKEKKIDIESLLRKYLPIGAAVTIATLLLILILDSLFPDPARVHSSNVPHVDTAGPIPGKLQNTADNRLKGAPTDTTSRKKATAASPLDIPKIVSMDPPNRASNVDPNLQEVRVTFDRPMAASFSWTCPDKNHYPKRPEGKTPQWTDDGKTCILPVQLESMRLYCLGLNDATHKDFKSKSGAPLKPFEYTFTTGTGQFLGVPSPR